MTDTNQDPSGCVAAAAAALQALATGWDDSFYVVSDEQQDQLRSAAISLLRKLGGVAYKTTISWWDGCHCHGHDESVAVEASTPEELGALVAGHQGSFDGLPSAKACCSALDGAEWTVTAGESDRSAANVAYKRGTERSQTTTTLKGLLDAAQKTLKATEEEVMKQQQAYAARSRLTQLCPTS